MPVCYGLVDGGDYEGIDMGLTVIESSRKTHICGDCGDEIKVGEKYHRHTFIFDGAWEVYKTCDSCQKLREEIQAATDLFVPYGELACCYMEFLYEH